MTSLHSKCVATVALIALMSAACTSETVEWFKVDIVSAPPEWPEQSDGSPMEWVNDSLGYGVMLERAHVAVQTIDLKPCSDQFAWKELVVSVAHAHSPTSATRIGVPYVDSFVSQRVESDILVGSFAPPPGRYCGLVIGFGPADSDALGLPDDIVFVGSTLFLSGSYRDDTGETHAWSVHGSNKIVSEVSMPPLELDVDGNRHFSLRLRKAAVSWIESIDLAHDSSGTFVSHVMDNVAHSIEIHQQ